MDERIPAYHACCSGRLEQQKVRKIFFVDLQPCRKACDSEVSLDTDTEVVKFVLSTL